MIDNSAQSPQIDQPPGAATPDQPRAPRTANLLRLWPITAAGLLQWLAITLAGWLVPGTMIQFYAFMFAPGAAMLVAIGWWMFGSRLSWQDTCLGLFTFFGGAGAACLLGHETMNPLAMFMLAAPVATTAWGLWILAAPFLKFPVWRAGLVVVLLGAWGIFDLVRLDGMTGTFTANYSFRWSRSAEEEFLAQKSVGSAGRAASSAADREDQPEIERLSLQPGDWPAFRGLQRDSRLKDARIRTDWKERPLQRVWRHRIGPGWSSFAVVGTRIFTQEQRGDQEAVVCYAAETGNELWAHSDDIRFTEVIAGPGPRATPTFDEGRIYSMGAKGTLNCLDALTGKLIWTRNMADDAKATLPPWGFASSPLVVDGLVVVYSGAADGKAVMAYRASSGEPAWSAGDGGHSYCSVQKSRLAGIDQLLVSNEHGLLAFEPATGKALWKHVWAMKEGMSRVTQPAILGDSDVLVGTGFDIGTRRIHVTHSDAGWKDETLWTTRSIRPYYNDLVVQGDHLYGFDNNFFVCVSLADGTLKWKARGYGNGQVLLLADQNLLLVLSEQGEVALLEAYPQAHKQLAVFQAIEGKTWNHPVVAHGKLFIRNGEEAACYDVAE